MIADYILLDMFEEPAEEEPEVVVREVYAPFSTGKSRRRVPMIVEAGAEVQLTVEASAVAIFSVEPSTDVLVTVDPEASKL